MKTARPGGGNERRKLYVERRRLGDVKAHWRPNILFLGKIWALTSYQEEVERPSIQRVHFRVFQALCALAPREMIVKSYSSPTVRQHKVVTPQKYCHRQVSSLQQHHVLGWVGNYTNCLNNILSVHAYLTELTNWSAVVNNLWEYCFPPKDVYETHHLACPNNNRHLWLRYKCLIDRMKIEIWGWAVSCSHLNPWEWVKNVERR